MRSQLSVWGAVALVAIGLVWLIERLAPSADVLGHASRWWPAALVLVGVGGAVRLLMAQNTLRGPLIITIIGLLLLGVTLEPLPSAVAPFLWPAILILAGIGLLVRLSISGAQKETARVVARLVTVGEARRIKWPEGSLSLGTVTAVLSGCVIDLTAVKPLDSMVRVDITAIASGVDLIIPAEWRVEVDAHPIMGRCRNLAGADSSAVSGRTLRVEGLAIFAGIAIRNPS